MRITYRDREIQNPVARVIVVVFLFIWVPVWFVICLVLVLVHVVLGILLYPLFALTGRRGTVRTTPTRTGGYHLHIGLDREAFERR